MKRGEVWLVPLDPTVGSEISKIRPCVIVSPDQLNDRLRTVIVAPLTSAGRPARFRVPVDFRGKPGLILADQIRAVDRGRPIKLLGDLDPSTLGRLLDVLTRLFSA